MKQIFSNAPAVDYIRVIPLAQAAQDVERYCLEDVVDNYKDDLDRFWTPETTDDGPSCVSGLDMAGKTIEATSLVTMATWSNGSLYASEQVAVIMIEGSWYAIVDNTDTPEWM